MAATATASAGAVVPGFVAALVAAVHVVGHSMRWLDTVSRYWVLSLSGGVSVAYVFTHVLPELHGAGERLGARTLPGYGADTVYLVVLAGFVTLYGVERIVRRAERRGEDDDGLSSGVFWVHIGSFGAYNALVGYLLFHPEAPGIGEMTGFAIAMLAHSLVVDYGLRTRHDDTYRRSGRWVLVASVLTGALLGAGSDLGEGTLGLLFAFLAGTIVLNVVKEELPERRESRFPAFAAGVAGYAALLAVL
jgi:hypothetical protein